MGIKEGISELIRQMKSKGWYSIQEDQDFITMQNAILFTDIIDVVIPVNKKNKSYPILLESFLNILIQVDESFLRAPIVPVLFAQASNMRNKFSKKKKNWILSEPGVKYNANEIPDIYIPKI